MGYPDSEVGIMAEQYDAIIIGTGAGGGTLALHLAQAGKRILVLERGAFLPQEKLNWDTSSVFWIIVITPKRFGRTRMGRTCIRSSLITWAGRPRCMGRRCFGCAQRTLG